MDINQLTAFDVHVHLEHQGALTETEQAAARHFKAGGAPRDWPSQAEYYRSRKIGCVVFTVQETLTGRPHASNDEVAQFATDNADIAIAFCSINPHRGQAGVDEARRLVAAGAVRGLKLTGMRGGGGIRLKYGNPMPIDDVAVDFPDMPIIMAHPSFPWQDEAISICMHKPQVYIDLSGWSPKYFSPTLVQYANTVLKHKVLFGSDYPWITPDKWMADFAAIGIRDEVRPLIMKENAAKLFGLA